MLKKQKKNRAAPSGGARLDRSRISRTRASRPHVPSLSGLIASSLSDLGEQIKQQTDKREGDHGRGVWGRWGLGLGVGGTAELGSAPGERVLH